MKRQYHFACLMLLLGLGFTAYAQPTITANNNNTVCPSAATNIIGSLSDEDYYPAIPSAHELKHYVYEWHRDAEVLEETGHVLPVNDPGDYYAVVSEYPQVQDADGNWSWAEVPDVVTNSNSVQIRPAEEAIARFSLNDVMQSPQQVSRFMKCTPIWFASESIGDIASYEIAVTDPTFETEWYNTGELTTLPDQLDILNFCNLENGIGACDVLADPGLNGLYGIKFTAHAACGQVVSTAQSLIYVSSAPADASVQPRTMTTNSSNSNIWYEANNSTVANPDVVGRRSTIFNFSGVSYYGSPSICSIQTRLYPWDSGTNSWGPLQGTYSANLDCQKGHIVSVPITAIGGNDFFGDAQNAPDNSIWRLVTTLANDCGSYTIYEVIKVTDNYQ